MAAIETSGLTKRFDEGVLAIDGLDLVVEDGEVFGFLGPNGAGKSTTIDVLLDYDRPTAGSATVLGLDAQDDAERIRRHVGVLPEGFGLYERLTGRRHLEFAIDWADADDDPNALLDRVGLAPDDGARRVGGYSKGMRQRLAMAMALVGDPDLLILDEPSSGLDPNGIRLLRDVVREEADAGTTVFFSSHVLGQVEAVCDRVGILQEGSLVATDSVDGLRETVGAGSDLRVRIPGGEEVDVTAVNGVDDAVRSGDILEVRCSTRRAKARVVAHLVDAGVDVLDVESTGASLEDVFTAYTTQGTANETERRATVDAEVVP